MLNITSYFLPYRFEDTLVFVLALVAFCVRCSVHIRQAVFYELVVYLFDIYLSKCAIFGNLLVHVLP